MCAAPSHQPHPSCACSLSSLPRSPLAHRRYRGFNFPHQAATWLALYRVARNYDKLTTYQAWDWYLWGAFNTALQVGQASVGFMDGTVFREILFALQTEGASNSTIAGWASQLNANMLARAQAWSTVLWPYGSEFAVSQEGMWSYAPHCPTPHPCSFSTSPSPPTHTNSTTRQGTSETGAVVMG